MTIVVCVGSGTMTAAQQFEQFSAQSGLRCMGGWQSAPWTPPLVVQPSPTYAAFYCGAGCRP